MTDTTTPSRRPFVRCHRIPVLAGQEIPLALPGTILQGTDGEVVIFVGDAWPTELVDIATVANQFRNAWLIQLVGDIWKAGRPFKHALHDEWSAPARVAREAARAARRAQRPEPPKTRCEQPTRSGAPCQNYAGVGTDTTGTGPCSFHGGDSSKRDAAAAKLTQAIRANGLLTAKSRTRDLTLREQLDQLIALRELALAAENPRRRTRTR